MACCERWKLAALHKRDLLSGKQTQEVENDRTSSLKILFYLFFCYKELRHLGDQPTCAKSSLYLDSFFFYITSFLIPVGTESVHTNRLFLKNFVEIRSFHQERDRNWNIFQRLYVKN